jgi:outer membrane protein OmpA-like peptidoglycan-associated protein
MINREFKAPVVQIPKSQVGGRASPFVVTTERARQTSAAPILNLFAVWSRALGFHDCSCRAIVVRPQGETLVMKMNRGIWVVLTAVVLVAIGSFVSKSIIRPAVPPVPPGPVATSPEPKEAAAGSSAAQNSDQTPAPAARPADKQPPLAPAQSSAVSTARTTERAPTPAAAAAALSAQSQNEASSTPGAPASAPAGDKGDAAPAPAPPPPRAAGQTAANKAAPAAASSPASAPAPVVETAAKEAAPPSTPAPGQPAAASPDQTVGKETASRLVAALNDSGINFASHSAKVPASTREFLRKAADDLKQLPAGQVVEIAGYTDNTGDEALNVALSQRRADAVRDALIKFGAAPDMLVAKGYGSADPIASNDTPEGKKRNRRIEYHIVKTPT